MSSPDAILDPGDGARSWRRLAEPRGRRRRAAARALLDVAAVQARLPLRAGADGRRVHPGPGRGPARRAARGLVLAARQRAARAQCRPAAVRGRGAGGIRRRDLAAADRVHQDPAALPGQGDDRAGVARGAAAGQHLHDRPPGAAGVSGPAVGAARADLHPRPHVHVGVLDRRLDPPAGRHRGAAGDGQPGADLAGLLRHPDRGGHVLAAGRGADRPGARRAGRPPVQAPVHADDHRVAGQGTARARHRPRLADRRRAAWEQWYGPVAATRTQSSAWYAGGWAIFGLGYVGAIAITADRASAPRRPPPSSS